MALPPALSKKVQDAVAKRNAQQSNTSSSNPRSSRNSFSKQSKKQSSTRKPTTGTLSFNSKKLTSKPFQTPQFNSISGFTSFSQNPSFAGSTGFRAGTVNKKTSVFKSKTQTSVPVKKSNSPSTPKQDFPKKPESTQKKNSISNNNPFPTISTFVDSFNKSKKSSNQNKKGDNVFFPDRDSKPTGFKIKDEADPLQVPQILFPQPQQGGATIAEFQTFFESFFKSNPEDTTSGFKTEDTGLPAPQFEDDLFGITTGNGGKDGDSGDSGDGDSFIDSILNDPVKLGVSALAIIGIVLATGGKKR